MLTRTVAIHHVRAAIRGAELAGFDINPLLERAGIAAALLDVERARVSTGQFGRLVQELWLLLDDEFIGFGPARSRVGTFAMMCHATVHCSKDLRGALRRAAEFYALFPSGPEFRLVEDSGSTLGERRAPGAGGPAGHRPAEARIEFRVGGPDEDPDHFRAETLLIVAHRFSGWLVRRRIPLHRVELAYAAPPHVLEYGVLFGAPCAFGAETTALVFDRALLNEPVLQDEAGIAAFLRRAPQDVLARIDYGSTTAARVRRLVGQALPGPGSSIPGADGASAARRAATLPTEAEIAERLAVSPQTLRRRLALENTSFQQIRDQMRRDHAIVALAQGRIPIERISEQLGFSEPSAFHRAFKRWTGTTPRAYHPGAADSPHGA
jgi:AraC-like DNA-binding protein